MPRLPTLEPWSAQGQGGSHLVGVRLAAPAVRYTSFSSHHRTGQTGPMQAASIALAVTGGCALAATVAIELATVGPAGRRQLRRGERCRVEKGFSPQDWHLPKRVEGDEILAEDDRRGSFRIVSIEPL